MNLDFSAIGTAFPFLMSGLLFSLEITVVAFSGGMILGSILAVVRHAQIRGMARAATIYITLMRSIPLLMVLFWFFFLVPILLGHLSGSGRPIPVGGVYTALITFTLFEAAYYAEIIRSGLRAVAKGQYEAAAALGLSQLRTYRLVILPQVLRRVSPIILTQTIILFQDTSLVYVMSLTDLLGAASKIAQRDGTLVEMYLTVALLYLLPSVAGSQVVVMIRNRNRHA